mmetsp:Transcript_109785/g.283718  ORF Transcript_109785/g.283718 Transcript_109785/m.283718 type:complete len:216 (-) Transcript_109785:308-955(-)|eukprot:CAMPEP_0115257806 /NCGR_PEP_ID=MMETSP0270-20121206/46965_1 /TAXON_ID=71861 /ORGANISM="Scrippsiella trochoidea, Strain CCMP3099" /LENGTH=215 /DNA_ID=CAMNT_0002673529 /DNA_START=1 /DNA_END=648 /DNA_ORIENTATION=-
MGKGKGKKGKFGGKGFSGGGVFGGPSGPITEQPPIYNPEGMKHLPPPNHPPGRQDVELIAHQRNLVNFWKRSCFHVPAPVSGSRGAAMRASFARGGMSAHLDMQQREIMRAGGVRPEFFPAELLLRAPVKLLRGKGLEKSILDALKKLESKEGTKKDKKEEGQGDATADAAADEPEDLEDDDFGDDDDLGQYGDFEDGMGNDFEDDGGGDGDAEL